KVIGFTGRVLPQFDEGNMGKYVNSPETPIFSKSRLLYGLSKAKDHIREANAVLLVEGQMDVIMSHQDGVKNVVGTSGTALTDDQLSVLKRYANKLILNFDNDEAGKRAMERSIDLSEARDFETEVLDFSVIPESGGLKDPADIVSEKPGLLKEIVSRSIPAMEYYFSRHPTSDVLIGIKKENVRAILKKIMNLPSAVTRSYWLSELSLHSGVKEADLLLEAKSLNIPKPASYAVKTADVSKAPSDISKSRKAIIAEKLISFYSASDLAKSELQRLKEYLPEEELELYNAMVLNLPDQSEITRQKIAELSLISGLMEEDVSGEVAELANQLELEALMEKRDDLSAEMKSKNLSEEEKYEKAPALMEIVKKIETIRAKK
ncbi:MAG: toprim domain-containing protein, partial [Parcubacteria group bacterium]